MGNYFKLSKPIKRRIRKVRKSLVEPKYVLVFLGLAGLISVMIVGMNSQHKLHTAELLNSIARVESNFNYNAYFGNSKNTSIQFTSMTVGEVLAWQKQFVEQGSPSSAVGRYQFIDSTLRGLIEETSVDETTVFDARLQDQLANALLERRGVREYASQKISKEEFAHNLSKEWAALPMSIGEDPDRSYYAGDGLNKARLSPAELFSSIETVHKL